MSAAVSIVIPSWNGRALLERFLPSVLVAAVRYAATGSPVEIIIVDDGSTDGTGEWVAEQARRSDVALRCLPLATNRGFCEACNQGVNGATFPRVLLLNNDVEMHPDGIQPLSAAFDREDRLFAVHCRVVDFDSGHEVGTGKMGSFARGFLRVHRSYVVREPRRGPLFSMFAGGGSAMVSRAAFLELGGFDPIFAPFYFEDVELSYRAWKRGWSVAYEPASEVRHRFSSTIGPLAGRKVEAVSHRNRLMMHWIHLHDGRWLAAHVCWTIVLALTGPITLRPRFFSALWQALRKLPIVRAKRRVERARALRSDRDVIGIFEALARRVDVRPYDDPRELESDQREKASRT
jgi:GT2 family glycosyltransferase